jgi:hypothetical protein
MTRLLSCSAPDQANGFRTAKGAGKPGTTDGFAAAWRAYAADSELCDTRLSRLPGSIPGRRHHSWRREIPRPEAVEVFFDVVFVFTLTQLTRTLEEDLSLASIPIDTTVSAGLHLRSVLGIVVVMLLADVRTHAQAKPGERPSAHGGG